MTNARLVDFVRSVIHARSRTRREKKKKIKKQKGFISMRAESAGRGVSVVFEAEHAFDLQIISLLVR